MPTSSANISPIKKSGKKGGIISIPFSNKKYNSPVKKPETSSMQHFNRDIEEENSLCFNTHQNVTNNNNRNKNAN